jgi:hypothetical protein
MVVGVVIVVCIFKHLHVYCCQPFFFLPYDYSEGITLGGSIHEVNFLIKMADDDGKHSPITDLYNLIETLDLIFHTSKTSGLSVMGGEVSRQICNRASELVLTPRSFVHLLSIPVCWRW